MEPLADEEPFEDAGHTAADRLARGRRADDEPLAPSPVGTPANSRNRASGNDIETSFVHTSLGVGIRNRALISSPDIAAFAPS